MKTRNLLKISALSAMMLLCGQLFSQVQTFEWQGTQREYIIRVPADCTETTPVMFFLHGLGDNITRLENEFHFQQVADAIHWAIVVPQALSQLGYTMWNAGLMASSIDDSGFLMALTDALAEEYPINLDSVFFTGFSMGGFMSHRMAIEHGDRITGCAPVSGLITHSIANQTAVAPVRMLYIHGTNDPVVGYDGNSQYFGMNLGLGATAIIDYWKNANGCVDEPVIDTFPDLKNDGLRFVRYTYDGEAELQHIKVIGGDHSWYMNDNLYDVNYLTEILNFFKSKGSEGVSESTQSTLTLWPNPTTGRVTIEAEEVSAIEVMDIQGRCVAKYVLENGNRQVDLGSLPEGLYFVKSNNGAVQKLLLTR